MTIALDASTTQNFTSASRSSYSFNHTSVDASPSLVIAHCIDSTFANIASATYGSQSLTKYTFGGAQYPIWYGISPASGTQLLTLNPTGAPLTCAGTVCCSTWTGTDLTTPLGNNGTWSISGGAPRTSFPVSGGGDLTQSVLITHGRLTNNNQQTITCTDTMLFSGFYTSSGFGFNPFCGFENPLSDNSITFSWQDLSSGTGSVIFMYAAPVPPPMGGTFQLMFGSN